jgi:hypothetical protein
MPYLNKAVLCNFLTTIELCFDDVEVGTFLYDLTVLSSSIPTSGWIGVLIDRITPTVEDRTIKDLNTIVLDEENIVSNRR